MLRNLLLVVAVGLTACGGSEFSTVSELGDGGGDVVTTMAEAGPEAAPGEDASQEAHGDVVGHVVETGAEATTDAADAGPEAAPDAPHEAEAGPACLTDLSGVGTGDFSIAFTLTTTWTAAAGSTLALVSQRSGGCGTSSVFWDITLNNLGGIVAATDDGDAASYLFVEQGSAPVSDGNPHRIVVSRVNGQLSIAIDGTLASARATDAYAFGTFPALTLGSDSCSTMIPLAGHGAITSLCLSRL